MHSAVGAMLARYNATTFVEQKNALKEIVQEIALLGLFRGGFFEKAAFYGGTALRIFYGLPRFSEDLDFSLLKKDTGFDIEHYCKVVKDEMMAYGFDVECFKVLNRSQFAILNARPIIRSATMPSSDPPCRLSGPWVLGKSTAHFLATPVPCRWGEGRRVAF